MAYRTEKNNESIDIVIDGFESGIADSPYEGLADMRNVNPVSVPKEAGVGFKNTALTLPPTGLGTVSFTAGNGVASYLIVAGGGAGGGADTGGGGGGGGGAGGFKTGSLSTIGIGTYAVTVGAAGTGGLDIGGTGGNSVFSGITAHGGGGGGAAGLTQAGANGGSGGGGAANVSAPGGTGTGGEGNDGGAGAAPGNFGAGGGGGAGAVGASSTTGTGGAGGTGTASSITGSSVTYGGGGGGGGPTGGGTGGSGGGANGRGTDANGINATANTGGGGGGANSGAGARSGGNGGTGVVIIAYPTGSITASGGSITTSGGNTIHTFNSSSNLVVTAVSGYTADTLIVSSTTGFVSGMAVTIGTSTIGGVTVGDVYYVGSITSTTFKLYLDPFLISVVTLTSGGAGTFTVPTFGKPIDSVSTPSTTFDSATGENYKWDFIIDDAGLIWYIGNGPNGTLNQLYFTGNIGHSTATTANVTAWKGYLFGFMAAKIDYIKISTLLASGPNGNWHYAWQDTSSSSVGHKAIPATDDALYFCNGITVGSLLEKISQTFDPSNSATYTYNDSALTLPSFDLSTCLAQLGVTLLVGGISTYVYPWDRVSTSFNYPLIVAEPFTKNIVSTNSSAYIFAGQRGRIYLTNGSNIQLWNKFPDQIANTESPYYIWGDGLYFRNQVYFGISATTNAGVVINNYSGVWAIDLDKEFLYLANALSTASYAGSVPVLLPMGNVNPVGNALYVGWIDGSGNGGIDAGSSSPYTNFEAYIDTDMIPVGTYYQSNTDQQIEYKLAKPLVSGESVKIYWRGNLTDNFTQVTSVTAVVGQLSGAGQVNFQKQQWVQLRITLSSTASSPSYCRLREIRMR